MIGSPRVFHTAPPQPASKARRTWSPVLVGGADASQKGLGARMPARSIDRSAIGLPEGLVYAVRRALAFGDGIDDLLAAVGRVAAGEVARVAGAHGDRIVDRPAAVERQPGNGGEELEVRRLPGGLDDGVGADD